MDMKVNSTVYKGIEFIQLNSLPNEQKERLLKTINHELFIKIMVDDKIVGNCLQFKDYETWFDNIYGNKSTVSTTVLMNAKPVVEEALQKI